MADPDYVYDHDNWDCTYEWGMRSELIEHDDDLDRAGSIKRFSTLIEGPPKFAARVVISVDEDGEPDEMEIQWFDSEAQAREACGMPPYITGG